MASVHACMHAYNKNIYVTYQFIAMGNSMHQADYCILSHDSCCMFNIRPLYSHVVKPTATASCIVRTSHCTLCVDFRSATTKSFKAVPVTMQGWLEHCTVDIGQ